MADKSRFFRSEAGDRKYPAEDFAEYFRSIIRDGVTYDNEAGLSVEANGANMQLTVNSGAAFVQGYQYFLYDPETLIIGMEDAGQDRIDRIILRVDILDARRITLEILKGEPGGSPEPPALTQDLVNAGVYEYSLAQVYITGGQGYLEQSDITIEAEKAKMLNSKYRQIFIGIADPDPSEGSEGDIFIKY